MKVSKAKHVKIDNRRFIVEYDEAGQVKRIKERKTKEAPMIGDYDVTYWHPRHHNLGKKDDTLPKRIIAKASTS